MFRFVHSLHHRNTDVEPFAGLSMHPVEHLFYYACVFPSLFLYASPFAFLWNGVHLLLSPGASHSGFEDHFQADAYHTAHHRYFEVNYAGAGAAGLDVFFGSFLARFKEEGGAKARADAKATLRGAPTLEAVVYMLVSAACACAWLPFTGVPLPLSTRAGLAALAGFGPVVAAVGMTVASGGSGGDVGVGGTSLFGAKGAFGATVHTLLGSLLCSVPVSWMVWLALGQ